MRPSGLSAMFVPSAALETSIEDEMGTEKRTTAGVSARCAACHSKAATPAVARRAAASPSTSGFRTVRSRAAAPGPTPRADAMASVPPLPRRASLNSRAVAKRSAGSFSSAVSTAASTCGGTVRRCVVSGLGASVIIRATIAWAVAPVNGGSPVSISYATAPSA